MLPDLAPREESPIPGQRELKGEEPREAYRTITGLAIFLPIVTIDAKIRIAERIAAGDVHLLGE